VADFPALPLWTDAYLADTADLDACEHGCYLILLMVAWRRPDCALPNDKKWMHRTLNAYCGGAMHGNRFNATVPKLLSRFFQLGPDDKWRQKRLGKERDFVSNLSRIQSENSRKRWSETRKNNDLADAMGMPAGIPPTPTPTPKEERKEDNNTVLKGKNGAYAFQHGCVKLTEEHLAQWRESFSHVSVTGTLIAAEPWLAKQKSWFNAAAGLLDKREREAVKPPEPKPAGPQRGSMLGNRR